MILIFVAIVAFYFAGEHCYNDGLRRRAALMTDDELRAAVPRAHWFGSGASIYSDELSRRDAAREFLSRAGFSLALGKNKESTCAR